jgi:murein DD-endopeptidase MepM/ murein hydrolase activator NlpD
VEALSISEIREQIDTKQKEKAALEAENLKLQKQIEETGKQANTLQNAVKTLDTTQKKLQNDLKVTQTQIKGTELTIQQLAIEVANTEKKIEQRKNTLGETLRNLRDMDESSFIETLLLYDRASEFWDNIETLKRFQENVRADSMELSDLKDELADKKKQNESKSKQLTGFKEELTDKKIIVDQNKQAKTTLLNQTKSKETLYKELLARNIELGKKFEQELFNFENQLRIAIDPSKLPSVQLGVLSWPLDSISITQRFGKTVDSRRLYVSGTHNGVDFRASVGTAVKNVFSGVVKGTGNTDDQPGCYSYGRWVMIEHPNGLSSLYSHLSATRVSAGQTLLTGDIIGYSGGQPGVSGSGFSTGPHLHLGLYATEGVTIQKYTQSKFCKKVSIPVASANAYLDPLAYLPPLP